MADICINCDSRDTRLRKAVQKFWHGQDNNTVLVAELPYVECVKCGFTWGDYRTEAARTQAIILYLEHVAYRAQRLVTVWQEDDIRSRAAWPLDRVVEAVDALDVALHNHGGKPWTGSR